jgi:hypothetical protein
MSIGRDVKARGDEMSERRGGRRQEARPIDVIIIKKI